MRKQLLIATVVMIPCAALSAGGDSKKDLEALQGNWNVASVKLSMGEVPPDEVLKSIVVTVKGDEMKLSIKEENLQTFKLTLDAAKQPKTVDFLHQDGADKGKKEMGIYKVEGDTFTICTNDDFSDKAVRPTEFATKEGTKIQLLTLKKAK